MSVINGQKQFFSYMDVVASVIRLQNLVKLSRFLISSDV